MKQLSTEQRELVSTLTKRLGEIPGIKAVVLGGSYARGRAQPDSDIDLGLFYSESAPFSIADLRQLAESLNDTPVPVVTDYYGWGPWVNGGAWLTIRGQRVDFIYRNLEHVTRVINDAEAGCYSLDYLQQPPFGFFSGTYLGEIDVCIPLSDSESHIASLKKRVTNYPDGLRRAVIQDCLWQAEFNLAVFAPKFASRADAYGTASCLTRATNQLLLALFALNRRYWLNDKTSLAEAADFAMIPQNFAVRVQNTFELLGSSPTELAASVDKISALFRESVRLAAALYKPRFLLPK